MSKLVKQSPTLSAKTNKWLLIALMVFAFIGFLDTSYLAINHFSGADVNCSVTGGCNQVLTSKWSTLFGIPLSLLGLIHYFVLLVLSLLLFDTRKTIFLKLLTALATFGFLFSLYLTYLQFFVIQALCQYCLISAANSVILAILAWFLFAKSKK